MINYSKAVAANSDVEASEAFVFQRDDLYLCLMLSASGEDVFATLRSLVNEISESFWESEEPLGKRVMSCFEEVKSKISNFEEWSGVVSSWRGAEKLYLAGQGQIKVYLSREGLTALPLTGQLVSGYLKAGDRILISTESLDSLGKTDELIESPLNSFEDTVANILIEAKQRAPVAATLVEFEPTENLVEEVATMPSLDNQQDRVKRWKKVVGDLRQKLPQLRIPQVDKRIFILLAVILIAGVLLKRHQSASQSVTVQVIPAPSSTNVYQVNQWPLFLDLGLIKGNFFTSRMSLSVGNLLLLDPVTKTLVEIGLSNKSNTILAGATQLGSAQFASLNGDFAYVYSDKGVIQVNTQTDKMSVIVPKDTDWGQISDLYSFAGNVYLLDSGKSQIWKYVAGDKGYSSRLQYLKGSADLGGAQKMLIDSSIWVLKSGSEIDRFTAGVPDSFSPGGLDKDLGDISNFFISSDTDNIYIVDRLNSRLVVMDKSGKYISQYLGDKFRTLSDIAVDEGNKKIYLLDNGKIYSIDLK